MRLGKATEKKCRECSGEWEWRNVLTAAQAAEICNGNEAERMRDDSEWDLERVSRA